MSNDDEEDETVWEYQDRNVSYGEWSAMSSEICKEFEEKYLVGQMYSWSYRTLGNIYPVQIEIMFIDALVVERGKTML